MGAVIRKHPILIFYLVALAFPVALWTYFIFIEIAALESGQQSTMIAFRDAQAAVRQAHPIITQHRDGVPLTVLTYNVFPTAWPFFFFPFAPTVSALVIVGLGWGGKGLAALLGAFRPVRGAISAQEAGRIYLALLGLIALTCSAVVAGSFFSGNPVMRAATIDGLGLTGLSTFLGAIIVALFMNQGALLEELGWRGFAWPAMMQRFAPTLVAAVVLGVIWALWHFPREVPFLLAGQTDIPTLLRDQIFFILSCVSMSIVAAYFVNITGGSVLPAIMIHGMLNLLYVSTEVGGNGVRSDFSLVMPLMWAGLALLTLLLAGVDLGQRRRREVHAGDGSVDPAKLWSNR